jgi:hypothetical protein
MGALSGAPFFCTVLSSPARFRLLGSELGEGDEVSGGIFDADLGRSIKRGSPGHDDFYILDGGDGLVEVVDFDIEEGRALADGLCNGGDVFVGTGIALVHQFHVGLLEHGEGQLVSVWYLGCLFESEAFYPELNAGLNPFDEKDGVIFFTFMVFVFSFCPWVG